MLDLANLGLVVDGSPILADVNLALAAGEVLALLGPSGSGKTSLLRAVMGLVTATSGRVCLDGVDLDLDGRQLVPPGRRPFAFLFQNFTLFPHLDVQANILVGIRHLERSQRRQRLERWVGTLGIDHLLRRSIHDLSGGEQQRVALARTLVLEPRLLLLDEPFSNLDQATRSALQREVAAVVRETGIAALVATHDQAEAFFLAERVAVLEAGRVVACAAPQTLYHAPPSEWLARFTGVANCLDGDQVAALFPGHAPGPGRYLVRPEAIAVTKAGDQAGVLVEALHFAGPTTTAHLRTDQGQALVAILFGGHDLERGTGVSLALRRPPVRMSG